MIKERGTDLSVCLVEKGAEVGAHILSGNVFEPHALDELIPNWRRLAKNEEKVRTARQAAHKIKTSPNYNFSDDLFANHA